tara:strand:- start:529 stop:1335 length:807 start_codon:yes stop_codon:yes gene_type:complete
MTKIDLNKIVSEFTRKIDDLKDDNEKLLEKINSLSESFSDEKKLRKRKHNEIKISSEIGSNSVKLETEPIKKESVMENTKISILYEDMDKLKKENQKLWTSNKNLINLIKKLSKAQNYLINFTLIDKKLWNSNNEKIEGDKLLYEIKNNMGLGKNNCAVERKDASKMQEFIMNKVNISSKIPMAKIIVSSMDDLDRKFEEYNNRNTGSIITYITTNKMEEMLNNTFKIVSREDGVIGLRPPEKYKDTRGWQNGCWWFPKTCVEEIFLN